MSPGAGLRGRRNRREIINYRVNDSRTHELTHGRYRGAGGGRGGGGGCKPVHITKRLLPFPIFR